LVNTGWVGGGYGVGSRIKLSYTRAIIDAIHNGELENAPTIREETFGIELPTTCTNVPDEILIPENLWEDKAAYKSQLTHLAKLFNKNFEAFAEGCSEAILSAAPKV
jgi:phosphoenolpyruvate carboxykinase (ATP)